jgi:hypothetical protein
MRRFLPDPEPHRDRPHRRPRERRGHPRPRPHGGADAVSFREAADVGVVASSLSAEG